MLVYLGGLALFGLGLVFYLWRQARREGVSFAAVVHAFFAPPVFDDEETTRTAELLSAVLRAIFLISLIAVPTLTWLNRDRNPALTALLGTTLLGLMLALIGLVRRGHVIQASWLLPSVLTAIFTLVILYFGGLHSPLLVGYLIVIVIAGLLQGEQGAFLFAAINLSILLGIYYATTTHWWVVPQTDFVELNAWFVYVGTFSLTAVLLGLARRSLNEAREKSKQLLDTERKRARQMELLAEIARHLTGHDEPQALMDEATQRVATSFGFEYVGILLVEGDHLVPRAQHRQFTLGAQPGEPIPVTRGIVSHVVQTGQSYLTDDTTTDLYYHPIPGVDTASEMAVPLRLDRLVIGVLDVQSQQPGTFDATDVSTLESLADLLAASLQTSSLFTQLRNRERLARALQRVGAAVTASLDLPTVLATLCAETLAAFDADGVGVWLVEDGELRVAAVYGQVEFLADYHIPLDHPTSVGARVVREGRPLFVNDLQASTLGDAVIKQKSGAQALLASPIIQEARILGILTIIDLQHPQRFSAADLPAAELLGGQLAVAIQNAQLFEERQRQLAERTLLYECGQELLITRDFHATIDKVAARMVKHLGATAMCYYSYDETADTICTEHEYWTPEATPQERVSVLGIHWPLSDYPHTALALQTRTPQIIRLNDSTLSAPEREVMIQWDGQTIVMVPLFTSGRIVGYFEIWDSRAERQYSPEEMNLLTSLAGQAAIAAENARLQTALAEHVRELSALLTANAALLSTLELDPLLDNILRASQRAIPAAEKGAILLLEPASERLQIRATLGYYDPRVQTFAFAGSAGYSAKALREQRPLLIHDVRADPEIRYDGDIEEVRTIHAAIVAPLIPIGAQAPPIGVISLDATRRVAFTEADLRLLVAFANTAAIAIDNARLHAQVQALAATDGLTGIANRRAFDQSLAAELTRAGRYKYPVSLVILDIDSFKQYNDTYGHPAGDERLKAIARLLQSHVREPDLAARYGGEEFALILPHTHQAGAHILAERVRIAAEANAPQPATLGKPVSGYTLSLGVATFPNDADNFDQLLLAADNAEMVSKRKGKNRVTVANQA